MRQHDLKCHPRFFEAILNGTKRFEIRKDDRGFFVGDCLILKEWWDGVYTGRVLETTITYVLLYPEALKDGYVCMSLGEVTLL